MGVFNATQNQVLIRPLAAYQAGEERRRKEAEAEQISELRGLQIDTARQELEDAGGKKKAANMKAAADYELVLENIRAKRQATGAAELDEARDVVAPWIAEYDKRGIKWANESFGELVLNRLPESKRAEFAKAAGPDKVFDEDDMARVGLMIAVNEVENDPDPTSHQKHLQSLVDQGFITQKRANELIEAIEVKAGTVTGTTKLDPSQGNKTASGLSQAEINFEDAVIGAVGAVQTGSDLLNISFNTPGALGKSGALSTFGNEMKAFGTWLADFAGYEPVSAKDRKLQDQGSEAFNWDELDLGELELTGVEAVAFKAGVYGIAFAAAVAEQGTRPTDKDIQQFIDQIGGRSTSPTAFRRTVKQFMDRQDRRLHTIATVKGIGPDSQERAFGAWNKAYDEFNTTLAVRGRTSITDGAGNVLVLSEDGTEWVEL